MYIRGQFHRYRFQIILHKNEIKIKVTCNTNREFLTLKYETKCRYT